MRRVRRQPQDGRFLALTAAAANLLDTLLPGARAVFRDCTAVATSIGGQIALPADLDAQAQRNADAALLACAREGSASLGVIVYTRRRRRARSHRIMSARKPLQTFMPAIH